MCFSIFTNFLLLLLSYLILLWSKNILCMISVTVNLLKLALWLNIWSVLENVTCVHGKVVYSFVAMWRVL